MVEYEGSRRVDAPPDDVFAFVADVGNLPTFVPTVRAVEQVSGERVHVEGVFADGRYEDDGWVHVDGSRHRIEWGDDARRFGGWLSIAGEEDGASEIVVHVSFGPAVETSGRPLTEADMEQPDPIEANLEAALDSLRNLMEGTGGLESP